MIYCLYGRVTSWVVLPISPRRASLISNGVLSWVWGVPRGINVRNKRKCLLIPVDSWCRRRRVPRVCRICYLLRVNLHLPFQDLTGMPRVTQKFPPALGGGTTRILIRVLKILTIHVRGRPRGRACFSLNQVKTHGIKYEHRFASSCRTDKSTNKMNNEIAAANHSVRKMSVLWL